CQQAATQAESRANALDLRNDPSVVNALFVGIGSPLPAGWDGASYPVYVDPFNSSGSLGVTSIARVAPFGTPNFNQNLRRFTLLDDLEFTPGDATADTSSSVLKRSNKYTWAYLVKRPRVGDASVAELTIVVYNNRPLVALSDETVYDARGTGPIPATN